MKIFTGFDTKLDEKELASAIEQYGVGNAILTKKHRIFLLRPLVYLFLSIGVFALMVWVSYAQYIDIDKDWTLFWIIVSGQSVVTLVWIIHSIQTIFSTIKKYKGHTYFGTVSKASITTDGKFEHYLKHSFVSLILQVILMLLDIVLTVMSGGQDVKARFVLFGGVLLNFLFIFIISTTVYKIIDYEMRFNIFTPDHFSIYRQKGFFKPERITLPTTNIMIKELPQGMGAVLGYGKIGIFPEGGGDTKQPIKLPYVTNPTKLRKKLEEFTKSKQ